MTETGHAPVEAQTTVTSQEEVNDTGINSAFSPEVAAGDEFANMTDEEFSAWLDQAREGTAPAPQAKAPEPPQQAQPEPEPQQEPAAEDEGESPGFEDEGPKMRQRLTFANELDAEAARIYRVAAKQGKPISLSEAERRAKLVFGVEDAPAAQPEPETAPAQPVVSVDEIQERMAQVQKDMDAALEDFDTDKARELRDQLLALADERVKARESEMSRKAAQERQFAEQWSKAEERIVAAYPDMANHDSVMSKRAVEIFESWKALGDPRAERPDAPMLVGNLAAAELGIAPGSRLNAPKAPQKSSPAPAPGRTPPPTSGSFGTANPATSTAAVIDSMPDGDFLDFLERLRR